MPYEYNPLIKDCFQKTSEVTPADIARVESEISDLQNTTTDLKQKKVTKFFSVNDYLEDNEIAQYQGEDDVVNNLVNGFFYKKNPAFTITQNSDTFAYNVNKKLKIFNFDGTFFEQYYLAGQNLSTSDYVVIGLYDESIFTVCFNPALFVNRSLPPTADGNMIFYPFLNVNGVWDFSNPVSVSGGNYYYKGNQIRLIPLRLGLINAAVGANMTSPYNRYLWVSLMMSKYQSIFAFPYATNSNNELIALGVSNGLGAFGFQSYYTINNIASTTINVQGYVLTENNPYSQKNGQPFFQSVISRNQVIKTGIVDICRIDRPQQGIDINGFLFLSGSYYNGNMGSAIIAINSNNPLGTSLSVIHKSQTGTLLATVSDILTVNRDDKYNIVFKLDFGSTSYTGGLALSFFGNGIFFKLIE